MNPSEIVAWLRGGQAFAALQRQGDYSPDPVRDQPEITDGLLGRLADLIEAAQHPQDLWLTPGLSRRAQNILHALRVTHSVVTVQDLAILETSVLKNARNCGRKTRKELHQLVSSAGITPNWVYSP